MQIISRFEFGASQIGLRPRSMQLICTAAFIYYLKTSRCLIYNVQSNCSFTMISNSTIYQIIKHKEYGINNFEISKGIDISF